MKNSSYLPAYEHGTECSETLAHKIPTPRNYPEESIQNGNLICFGIILTLYQSTIYFNDYNTVIIMCNKYYS